ncbi:MAG: hypothetical protein VX992_06400 [Acidobacteriota bacterium]|nr:hypothetical protein [Acidobacteriota bacterium]
MKVLFVITHLSQYRLVAPVIDCALKSGWEVECWHDYSFPTTGPKSYLFPEVAATPKFQHGQPDIRSYHGPADLVQRLEHSDDDAVVSVAPLLNATAGVVPKRYPVWTSMQSGPDIFVTSSLKLKGCDLLALHSRWWLDWGVSHYEGVERVSDVSVLRENLESRSRYVGFPEAEAVRLVDRKALRRRWGVPSDQPVVVLLPFPQGTGRSTFWPRKIFGEPSRTRRVINVVKHGQFNHFRAAWGDANDINVVSAVRNFCDRNGAFLLVKSREKTPIPQYLRAVSDKCIYDESYYPPTIIEALSIANLCIGYYSLGVLEAAALGVPNLSIVYSAEEYLGDHATEWDSVYFNQLFNRRTGNLFQFDGVSSTASAAEAVALFQSRTLDDFKIDATAHDAYLSKFLGEDNDRAPIRTVNAVESLAKSVDVEKRRSEWLREMQRASGDLSGNNLRSVNR